MNYYTVRNPSVNETTFWWLKEPNMTEENFSCFAASPDNAVRWDGSKDSPSFRDSFQIDRDRILYSKTFRRMRGKTQVFISGYDDHVRNRLSHTLEVSQIACTISKALNLNTTLTEAIALGHDLGHTPFGHVGERTLNINLYENFIKEDANKSIGGKICFKHNWQSVRVACDLEMHNRNYGGLNLTKNTLWGFLHHSKLNYKDQGDISFYTNLYGSKFKDSQDWSFEAIVVAVADEIAQRHHDIDDGLITGILEKKSLISELQSRFKSFEDWYNKYLKESFERAEKEIYSEYYLSTLASAIVNFYVQIVVENTKKYLNNLKETFGIENKDVFYKNKSSIWTYIKNEQEMQKQMLSPELSKIDGELQDDYFKKRILLSYQAQKSDGKAGYIIKKIASSFVDNPQRMSDTAILMFFMNYGRITKKGSVSNYAAHVLEEGCERAETVGRRRSELQELKEERSEEYKEALIRTVIDYVSGMTDDYAIAIYEQLYGGIKQNRY